MSFSERFATFQCKRCNAFSTNGALSTADQQQQMKEHLDAAHPYWELEDLGGGAQDYKANFRFVSQQRLDTTRFVESDPQKGYPRRTSDRKQLFGVVGSTLLFFGVFTPIISAPIVGDINYFQNGKGDGVIILVLALVSIALVLVKKYSGLWITGGASLAVMMFTFVNFQVRISGMKDEMESKLAGNPFRGFADVAMQSIQIQWGWAVLVIGAVLLIAAAAISRRPANFE